MLKTQVKKKRIKKWICSYTSHVKMINRILNYLHIGWKLIIIGKFWAAFYVFLKSASSSPTSPTTLLRSTYVLICLLCKWAIQKLHMLKIYFQTPPSPILYAFKNDGLYFSLTPSSPQVYVLFKWFLLCQDHAYQKF